MSDPVFGDDGAGQEGPSKYVTLVSCDGFESVVLRDAAYISPLIKSMLDPKSQFVEAKTGRCHFGEISGPVLEKVADYLQYAYRYRGAVDIPEFDIPVEFCLELIVAADFLGLDTEDYAGRSSKPTSK